MNGLNTNFGPDWAGAARNAMIADQTQYTRNRQGAADQNAMAVQKQQLQRQNMLDEQAKKEKKFEHIQKAFGMNNADLANEYLERVDIPKIEGLKFGKDGEITNIAGKPGDQVKIKGKQENVIKLMAFQKDNPNAKPRDIYDEAARLSVSVTPIKASPSTNININTAKNVGQLTKKANEAYGTKIGESVSKRADFAMEAHQQNAQLDRVALAIAEGARTGFGEEFILNMRSAAQTLGVDTGDLSGQELIRKVSNEMALRLRNPDSGLGLTGNTSNKDLDFLKASVVGLARTEEGNKAIINAMQRFNKMKIDLATEQDRIIKGNDNAIPADINSRMLKFANNYELYTKEERKKVDGMLGNKKVRNETQNIVKVRNPDTGIMETWDISKGLQVK